MRENLRQAHIDKGMTQQIADELGLQNRYERLIADISVTSHIIRSLVHDCCTVDRRLEIDSLQKVQIYLEVAKGLLFSVLDNPS